MDKSKETAGLRVKYGGELKEINVNTFLSSLSGISATIDEVSNEIGEGQKLEIRIRAIEQGSFLIDIGLIAVPVLDIVRTIDVDVISKVVRTVVDIFKLRKFLKGEKPEKVREKGDDLTVTSQSGNQITINRPTFNIYDSNIAVGEAMAKHFSALNSDSSIESFEIQDAKRKLLFESSREDFEMMSVKRLTEMPEENVRLLEQPTALYIFKLVWDKTRKWEFIHQGIKISAYIKDESFFQSIDQGEQFSKGDSLEVELQIKQIFSEDVNTYINDSYNIMKVFKHNRRPDQGYLNL